jgi:hypothetical protein
VCDERGGKGTTARREELAAAGLLELGDAGLELRQEFLLSAHRRPPPGNGSPWSAPAAHHKKGYTT